MTQPLVVFDQVTKVYAGGRRAVNDISFTIPRGQIVGVIGTNGSGKSTTLKLMAGLLKPTRGSVITNGTPAGRLHASVVSFLPEEDFYYESHRIQDTVRMYSNLFEDMNMERAYELLRYFKLELGESVEGLSKGNRARLKIVLALSRQVPLIVMDEPLSGLDPLVRESIIQSLIANMDMDNQSLVMTTHEVDEIEPLLDRVLLIQNGRLIGDSTVEEIHAEHGTGLVGWMKQQLGA